MSVINPGCAGTQPKCSRVSAPDVQTPGRRPLRHAPRRHLLRSPTRRASLAPPLDSGQCWVVARRASTRSLRVVEVLRFEEVSAYRRRRPKTHCQDRPGTSYFAGPRDLSRSITGHACCPGESAAYAPPRDGIYRRPRDDTGSGDAAPTERSHGLLRVLSTPSQRGAVLPWMRRQRSTHGSHAADPVPWPAACPAAARGAVAGRAASRECPGVAGSGDRPAARQATQVGPPTQRAGSVGGRPGGRGRPRHGGDVIGPLRRPHGSGLRSRHGAARGDGRCEREYQLRAVGRAADGGSAADRQGSPEFLPRRVRLRQRVRKLRGFEPGRRPAADYHNTRAGRHQHPPGYRFALASPTFADIEADIEADAEADAEAVTNGHLYPVPLLVQLSP